VNYWKRFRADRLGPKKIIHIARNKAVIPGSKDYFPDFIYEILHMFRH